MNRRRIRRRKNRLKNTAVVGFAWYRPEQWERLREIAADSDKLPTTYKAWMRSAEKGLRNMRRVGIYPEKVDIDVEELLNWCNARNLPVDSAARAQYTSDKIRQLHQGSVE